MPSPYWRVPRLWEGERVFCVGGGPSLRDFDPGAIRGRGRVIAVNDACRLCPFADLLYWADRRWFDWHRGCVKAFAGLRVTINEGSAEALRREGVAVKLLRATGLTGLETAPDGLRTGGNSGYQAINLAYHLGAKRIVLLGYDMGPEGERTHWHQGHPVAAPEAVYARMRPLFRTLKGPLAAAGVEVINASPRSRIRAWPRVSLGTISAEEKR